MAHVHTFEEAAPAAKGVIHLGTTSQYVVDNADLDPPREIKVHVPVSKMKFRWTTHMAVFRIRSLPPTAL